MKKLVLGALIDNASAHFMNKLFQHDLAMNEYNVSLDYVGDLTAERIEKNAAMHADIM